MGIVRAIQKGDAPASKFSKKARDTAKSMKGKDVKKYASTKHKGLPTRVKSENKLFENPAAIAAGVRAAMARAKEKELSSGGGKKVKVATALSNKSHPQHKKAKGIINRIKDKAKEMLSKAKKKKTEPKKQSKADASFYARQFGGQAESISNRLLKKIEKNKATRLKKKVKKIRLKGRGVYQDYDGLEGFGGELKGSKKKKFEDDRKKNGEQLGYKLTGKSDVNEGVDKFKKLPGKVVAKRMMSIKSLKPYASMVAKKKSVSTIDLERELPYDKVSVKDIDKVMKESVNERMDKRQAGETLKQLGGNRFIAMTGAKNFAVGPKGMGFKIGKNAKNVNYVRIDLDRGKDLYDMYFNFVSVRGVKVKAKVKGVYADDLRGMFTKHTGMYTSL